jgi:hypothetical protein
MPFKSQAQRNLFHAAENDPKLRKKKGISKKTAKKFTEHDTGGKLPYYTMPKRK